MILILPMTVAMVMVVAMSVIMIVSVTMSMVVIMIMPVTMVMVVLVGALGIFFAHGTGYLLAFLSFASQPPPLSMSNGGVC